MKKFSVLLFSILFLIVSCNQEKQEQKKEKVVDRLKVTYNKKGDFLTVYTNVYLIPNFIKKDDSVYIKKVGYGGAWNYINDTGSTCLKVRVDSIYYK